jgi:hypothetical protein
MAIDVSYRDTYTTSAEDLSRTNKNFIVNEGVAFDGMKVTQSGTPGMSVAVATGTGYFYGSGSNANVMYEFYSDASETVTIGASGVQGRIDIICLKVDASTGVASIVAVAGTPSGSPAVPATPASHYKLAEVAVGAGVTSITNANITDRRRSVFVMPTGARNQGLINGYIRATVASNNLTLAISTSPTSLVAPSATNPVGIWIGNTLRWITSSLSISANAGTNWFNAGSAELATREIDYFAYIGYNATDGITLGFARIPYARLYSDFNTTTTNEKYARISTITNAASGDNYVNIGRFAATLSAGAGHTWTVPTFTNANLIQEPIYETRWLDYTPQISYQFGSVNPTSNTINRAKYMLTNTEIVNMDFKATLVVGSMDRPIAEYTLPFNYKSGVLPQTFQTYNTVYLYTGGFLSNLFGGGAYLDNGNKFTFYAASNNTYSNGSFAISGQYYI